jgi:hypothetical protein
MQVSRVFQEMVRIEVGGSRIKGRALMATTSAWMLRFIVDKR